MEAGVDSLAATELSSRLQTLTGLSLSPTLVFDQPTPRAVAAHLLEQFGGVRRDVAIDVVVSRVGTECPLKLGGMVGRWPGGCSDELSCTRLQRVCGNAVGRVPSSRWCPEHLADMNSLSSTQLQCAAHGGFMAAAQLFDNMAVGISAAEASAMDPQQRLLTELGYATLHGSSYRRLTLMGGGSGVFVGIERPDWIYAQPPSSRGSVCGDRRQCLWQQDG